ncbi:TIR domain-containing protein [Methanosphaerula palustris]|uniref:TIR domain-containing protein n=1 Tax=Methanosphaerula palustris (strain ATCC BAA-1556 / DSM 19958 / E1-9c) TaxID=521011 RepID=B8GF82_METPE|nr:TIR domain-containing protein [Methanosphaerula palustris]ACL17888.1 hypothetical protein Mpal_2619 [Methanosphaerula palustris E1-9c]
MRIFISYRRKDALKFARSFASWLRDQGCDPWLDVENGIAPFSPLAVSVREGSFRKSALSAQLTTRMMP